MKNKSIINNLKKAVYDLKIEVKKSWEDYRSKEINLYYSIRNSLVNDKDRRQNNFFYEAQAEKIEELIKKDSLEIFEFLANHHLEKNQGYGKTLKRFQTPCYLCNQKTLTTLGWSEESYPNNLERFYCRLCRTSFGWIDIKDDPLELQLEMRKHYLIFKEKELEKDEKQAQEIREKINEIEKRVEKAHQFIAENKEFIEKHERNKETK